MPTAGQAITAPASCDKRRDLPKTTNPAIDRSALMSRAWAIFRETYRYPDIPFCSIGRSCFGWALQEAWRQLRDRAAVTAMPADVRAARINQLELERDRLGYADSYFYASSRTAQLDREIERLRV